MTHASSVTSLPARPFSLSAPVAPSFRRPLAQRSLVIPIVQQMSSVRARRPLITASAAAAAAHTSVQRTNSWNKPQQTKLLLLSLFLLIIRFYIHLYSP